MSRGKKKTFIWVLHGHQSTLHTTFVDMCMHVHVSCQPASHQVLMRPAGSLLGPNQTGETAQSWLSVCLLYPTSPKPPHPPPTLSSGYLEETRLTGHTPHIWKWCVSVKIYPVSHVPPPRPELENPQLKPETCLLGYSPLWCFLHLQQLW